MLNSPGVKTTPSGYSDIFSPSLLTAVSNVWQLISLPCCPPQVQSHSWMAHQPYIMQHPVRNKLHSAFHSVPRVVGVTPKPLFRPIQLDGKGSPNAQWKQNRHFTSREELKRDIYPPLLSCLSMDLAGNAWSRDRLVTLWLFQQMVSTDQVSPLIYPSPAFFLFFFAGKWFIPWRHLCVKE